jgi:ribonuclease PH
MGRKGRTADEPRDIRITRNFTHVAAGSVLYEAGGTRVLCTASVEKGVPPWMTGRGRGWMTAEYRMLPSSTRPRKIRDSARGRIDGRNTEIQRLIGRSLRSVVDMKALGERTIWFDCEVLEADGGTRTAAISGAYVAMVDAFRSIEKAGDLETWPLRTGVAAISVGVVDGEARLDLEASEDQHADVDMNIVVTSEGRFIEVQGTAEKEPFDDAMLLELLALARKGTTAILAAQERALAEEA